MSNNGTIDSINKSYGVHAYGNGKCKQYAGCYFCEHPDRQETYRIISARLENSLWDLEQFLIENQMDLHGFNLMLDLLSDVDDVVRKEV